MVKLGGSADSKSAEPLFLSDHESGPTLLRHEVRAWRFSCLRPGDEGFARKRAGGQSRPLSDHSNGRNTKFEFGDCRRHRFVRRNAADQWNESECTGLNKVKAPLSMRTGDTT